ncbi:MAG TPA: carbon starvation protein A, partial [Ignisphaera sp.]|nr:carbon starvation protein A [Ignisphaera sp.]
IIFIALAVYLGYVAQASGVFTLNMYQWLIILAIYSIIAASLPVWLLLQPRDYMNAFILWASLAIGGTAVIVAAMKGATVAFPAVTSLVGARVVGGQPSPFWPTIPLVVACGALSGFHSLVGSGTSSKQLAREIDALLVGYGGMLTEGFLSTMVIASMAGFLGYALLDPKVVGVALSKASGLIAKAMGVQSVNEAVYKAFVDKLLTDPSFTATYYAGFANAVKWVIIPYSYAYATNYAFGADITVMSIFGTLWITGFALTSLDTAARLGRFAWQELLMPFKETMPGLYKAIANRWIASLILVGLGVALAWGGAFLVIWPAFAGMNQLLASLALMTISLWVIKIQKAPGLGKALTVAPAIFLWFTVTLALIWYLIVVVPAVAAVPAKFLTAIVVGAATAIGLVLNLYLFISWILSLKRKEVAS